LNADKLFKEKPYSDWNEKVTVPHALQLVGLTCKSGLYTFEKV
jgi:hypothetical protein